MIPEGAEKVLAALVIVAVAAVAVLALFGVYLISEVLLIWQSSS
jgi:uncharacterized membrane protein YdbT with pleckstrin-like domain